MNITPMETIFNVLNETALILQEELSCTYLEALAETGENLFHGDIVQEEISELNKKRLKKKYEEINLSSFTEEQIRKAYQLAILKGMKDNVQPNHQMTPDTIGLVMSYLIKRFTEQIKTFSILDPAVGTGNLLMTIMNQLEDNVISAYGVEIDDILIKLAYIGANLQSQPVQLYNQDSLEHLFIDPVDVVVSDLPVGYYPNDSGASNYQLKSDKGHSYAHHLFIEQSINYTKPGGYLFFLIPNGLFESEEAPKLHKFLAEQVHIQGVIQLPVSIFKNPNAAKSILILQKKDDSVKAPKQVLIANLPTLSNQHAMETMLAKLDKWFRENKE
ncbi:SAM-dependent methyltransferase [Heyndrickxia sporothermodurans]|uniref:Class I SAM-dependent methyltransferase n=1 Tax=Heyndrickxia sporothermodurans TaxID=46224 RepID=A0AB37H577_9BACI|nr:class I SAM-dependent methyltransferase [Heyndrickxia sporothermodurans]MBL5766329.1 class I SAM-dependent methyltransferase [Heyndrickxia sporothermodurans]MBL5769768.1 class I SAM-dependent methyltransferase [Heyndrickxia sporothermodurans]MBL5773469.1 class I SAM-dependent methyltransferase [Heyndrickxia sporothermodurans]MBL5777626.1 class I SAM-dependent methyltransferase [Heyndrickxia sporothermodurans]MBL5781212.1 class I SAM-dependent methyltransferase [Heyndrickxia sporothermoduran